MRPSGQVFMVGGFPPPTNGRSVINSAMREKLRACDTSVLSIDLAAKSLERTWAVRLGLSRIARIGSGILRYWVVARTHPGSTLYIGLSGGLGQAFELIFILLGRLRDARIYIHHHSFGYIDRSSVLTRLLIRCAGQRATHVVLCARMADSLKAEYPRIEKLLVISNASFLPMSAPSAIQPRNNPVRFGFLGNIAFEKGIREFLDVMERLGNRDLPVRGYLAGPFQDMRVKEEVRKRLTHLPHVEYVGPKYGRDKIEFYKAIDVLLFPTKYANEAEPVAILEAFAHGVPVIGWERGCLASIITGAEGFLVPRSADFVSAAVEQIDVWRKASESFCDASKSASEQFVRMAIRDAETLTELLCNLRTARVSLAEKLNTRRIPEV